jgi:hypothetical protein
LTPRRGLKLVSKSVDISSLLRTSLPLAPEGDLCYNGGVHKVITKLHVHEYRELHGISSLWRSPLWLERELSSETTVGEAGTEHELWHVHKWVSFG